MGGITWKHKVTLVFMRQLSITAENYRITVPVLTIPSLYCSGDEFAAIHEQLLEISG